jgi:hypothetical protein
MFGVGLEQNAMILMEGQEVASLIVRNKIFMYYVLITYAIVMVYPDNRRNVQVLKSWHNVEIV